MTIQELGKTQEAAGQQSMGTMPSDDLNITAPGKLRIIKRNGKVVPFEEDKIKVAVTKAFLANESGNAAASERIHRKVEEISAEVQETFKRRMPSGGTLHIEEIQDQVELQLMRNEEYVVARKYILYREERAAERTKDTPQQTNIDAPKISVTKKDGTQVPLDIDRLASVVNHACDGLEDVSADEILEESIKNLYDGVSISDMKSALVMSARTKVEQEPNYSYVTARILLDELRSEALSFLGIAEESSHPEMENYYPTAFKAYINKGVELEMLDPALKDFDLKKLGEAIDHDRDYQFTYLGLQTLYDRYFIHYQDTRYELPQIFFMRVAMGLAVEEDQKEERAIEFYRLLSSFDYMSSTPTLFNSGTLRPQLSSCYLTTIPDDLDGIFGAMGDGEQTSGVSYSPKEKLTIAKLLLDDLKIDRIEVASARVSEGELNSVKEISSWAESNSRINSIEVLTFIDEGKSIQWLLDSGCKVQNLLTKGSLNHLKHQLKKTPDQHFNDISKTIDIAEKNSITTNIYLEDWSNGMKNSKDYVIDYLDFLKTKNIKRVLLPDTLGILTHFETYEFINEVRNKYPNFHIDFHGHNDYDLSVGNSLEAVRAGCNGLHLTINGMGERAGNTPLSSAVAAIRDFLPEYKVNVEEKNLFKASKLISTFSGQSVSSNKPIVGENVFTQTAGVHADGDNKKDLYFNNLNPSRFGRKRKYALGKTSGKANIKKNLDELGIKLNDDELSVVTSKVIELGDKKEKVTIEDLPYIISDVLEYPTKKKDIIIESYVLTHAKTLRPSASLSLIINDELYQESCSGDGQFDAFMNALKKIYSKRKKVLPKLIDYAVRIPPGSDSDAFCETTITWDTGSKKFKTRGLDTDQTVSAIKATEKMLNTE